MPVGGAWMTANRRPDPQQAPLHKLDPVHAEPGGDDENITWHGQPYQDVEPAPNVIGLEWVTVTPGMLLDRTPQGHDEGGPRGLAGPGTLARAHSVDYGADELESRREAPFQFSTDRYTQTSTDGEGPVGVAPVALLRGLTSDPVNNPPLESYGGRPFRFGTYLRTWVEHRFSPPERVHTYRVIRPNTTVAIGDAPPPADAGPYNVPFSSLSRAIRNLSPTPMLRRSPEPLDAGIVDDGLDQAFEPTVGGEWVTL